MYCLLAKDGIVVALLAPAELHSALMLRIVDHASFAA
jgi:hypothetical protein